MEHNPKKYFWITFFQSCVFLTPVLTLFYLERGLSYQEMFFLLITIVVSMFIFEVPTGMVGDRYGRKTSIMIGLLGFTLFNVGMYFAFGFWEFFFLYILLGISITFSSGSDDDWVNIYT